MFLSSHDGETPYHGWNKRPSINDHLIKRGSKKDNAFKARQRGREQAEVVWLLVAYRVRPEAKKEKNWVLGIWNAALGHLTTVPDGRYEPGIFLNPIKYLVLPRSKK